MISPKLQVQPITDEANETLIELSNYAQRLHNGSPFDPYEAENVIKLIKKHFVAKTVVREICYRATRHLPNEYQKALNIAIWCGVDMTTAKRWLQGKTRANINQFAPVIFMAAPEKSIQLFSELVRER